MTHTHPLLIQFYIQSCITIRLCSFICHFLGTVILITLIIFLTWLFRIKYQRESFKKCHNCLFYIADIRQIRNYPLLLISRIIYSVRSEIEPDSSSSWFYLYFRLQFLSSMVWIQWMCSLNSEGTATEKNQIGDKRCALIFSKATFVQINSFVVLWVRLHGYIKGAPALGLFVNAASLYTENDYRWISTRVI